MAGKSKSKTKTKAKSKKKVVAKVSKAKTSPSKLRFKANILTDTPGIETNTTLLKKLTGAVLDKTKFKAKLKSGTWALTVFLCDNQEIRRLNRRYRGKDKVTDVLSFPLQEDDYLGDIVISLERTLTQAKQYKVNAYQELLRLLIHGVLHLAGYDHERVSRKEAEQMRQIEDDLYGHFLPKATKLL